MPTLRIMITVYKSFKYSYKCVIIYAIISINSKSNKEKHWKQFTYQTFQDHQVQTANTQSFIRDQKNYSEMQSWFLLNS